MNKILLIWYSFILCLLCSCAPQNNISFNLYPGNCADGTTNAPYCMAVQINNNNESGAQNWINSTNYPISGLAVSISGVSNISYPGNGAVNQDPNSCTNSTINGGGSCTFYLQINAESYAVGSQNPITINVAYTLNNTLFGGSSTTASSSTTVYEQTNLYGFMANGTLYTYNYGGISSVATESSTQSYSSLISMAIDNSNYGYNYVSNQNGIYYYGNSTDIDGNPNYLSSTVFESTSSASNISNFYNIWSGGSILYTATNGYGIWNANFSSASSWNLLYNVTLNFASNINAMSNLGYIYLVSNTGNQLYNCNSSTGTYICSQEAVTATGTVNDIGISSGNFASYGYTGVYVATTSGLYAESGTTSSATNTWVQATGPSASTQIVSDNSGNLYIGDSSGKIWKIEVTTTNPVVPTELSTLGGGTSVSQMQVDNTGSVLYVIDSSNQLYSCPLTVGSCTLLASGATFGSGLIGLTVGSQLTN